VALVAEVAAAAAAAGLEAVALASCTQGKLVGTVWS